MNKVTSISEMQKFRFGCRVFCSDGQEGILSHVSFVVPTYSLNYIGVRLGLFFAKTVYLPFVSIESASGEGIFLNVTRAQLAAATQQVPPGVLLDKRSVVQNTVTKAQGSLDLVAVQPENGEIAYIVAHDFRPGQDTFLPRACLTKLETGLVTVSSSEAQLSAFPPYRSDRELQQDVEKLLFELAPLHVDLRGMNIRVLDGVLYLDGNVSSSLRGEIVANQAMGVVGLLEVKNHLVGDDQLANDLAFALGHDPRTRDLPIGVYPRLGVVRLSGAVHDSQEKAAAEEIARAFPGVRSVVNDLVIDPKAEVLNVMAAAAGGEAEDIVPGRYVRHTK
jgi:osmotically-inducible protein OsmY